MAGGRGGGFLGYCGHRLDKSSPYKRGGGGRGGVGFCIRRFKRAASPLNTEAHFCAHAR